MVGSASKLWELPLILGRSKETIAIPSDIKDRQWHSQHAISWNANPWPAPQTPCYELGVGSCSAASCNHSIIAVIYAPWRGGRWMFITPLPTMLLAIVANMAFYQRIQHSRGPSSFMNCTTTYIYKVVKGSPFHSALFERGVEVLHEVRERHRRIG